MSHNLFRKPGMAERRMSHRTVMWGSRTVRRGVSFLEVVLGVTLLGLVAGTLSMGVSAIGSSFHRQRDRLGAAEVASRLLLMRADDENSMPSRSLPIEYGERQYRWTLDEGPVLVTLSEPARAAVADGNSSSTIDLSKRMRSITVTVWLAENSGGAFLYDADLPSYTLTRLIDPLDFTTNDSAQRRLETQDDIETFMTNVVGSMSNTGEAPAGGGRQRSSGPQSQPRQSRPQQSGPPQRVPAEGLRDGGGG